MNQRGIALLISLALLSLLTMLLLALDGATRKYTRTVKTSRTLLMARIGAEGGLALARTLLEEDAARTPQSDHLLEPWAQPIAPFPLGEAQVRVTIEDSSGRYDLNALVNLRGQPVPERIEQVKRLFARLGIEAQLVDRIVDWIDPDDQPMPAGLERTQNTSQPYRPHNAPMATLGELASIPGFTPVLIERLRLHVTAGRVVDPMVNINTATLEVLESLDAHITSAGAAQLVQVRPLSSIQDLERLQALTGYLTALKTASAQGFGITVKSNLFHVMSAGTIGPTTVTTEAFLIRQGTDVNIIQAIHD